MDESILYSRLSHSATIKQMIPVLYLKLRNDGVLKQQFKETNMEKLIQKQIGFFSIILGRTTTWRG